MPNPPQETQTLLSQLFEVCADLNVSDIQLRADRAVYVETNQGMERLEEFGTLDSQTLTQIFRYFLLNRASGNHGIYREEVVRTEDEIYEEEIQRFEETRVADFSSYGVPYGDEGKVSGRLRIQAHLSASGIGITCRILNDGIPPLNVLGIEVDVEDAIKRSVQKRAGLCLVTGPTGSGKSTTLAAIIDWVRQNKSKHIVTIEDPIEYAYPFDMDDPETGEKVLAPSVVTQQEVGRDIHHFQQGLKDVLRKAPHIILLGEIRDREAMETCMEAAQTGHLVLSTLHTTGAVKTIGRILELYPKENHSAVLSRLAEVLIFIQSQGLLKGPQGRVLNYEFLQNNDSAVSSAIMNYDKGSNSLEDAIMRTGNVRWDAKLASLLAEGKIDEETFENVRLNADQDTLF